MKLPSLSAPWAIVIGAAIVASPALAQKLSPFRQCVEQAIPELDDYTSSAEVVAAGVTVKCLDRANPEWRARTLEQQRETRRELASRVLPLVLERRAAKAYVDKIWREEMRRYCRGTTLGVCADFDR